MMTVICKLKSCSNPTLTSGSLEKIIPGTENGKGDFSKVARERKGRTSLFMFSVSYVEKMKTNNCRSNVHQFHFELLFIFLLHPFDIG